MQGCLYSVWTGKAILNSCGTMCSLHLLFNFIYLLENFSDGRDMQKIKSRPEDIHPIMLKDGFYYEIYLLICCNHADILDEMFVLEWQEYIIFLVFLLFD